MRPTKIRRTQLPDVSPALYTLLLWGDWSAAMAQQERDGTEPFELWDIGEKHEAVWHAIVDRAIAEWTAVYPGTRPTSWWYWTAPELRRPTTGRYAEISGVRRCHETGVPCISNGWTSPPMVESTPAYLDRLSLWLPAERPRVPASAFKPQRFSYGGNLLVAPRGVPGQQHGDDDAD
jgi:hypothetical protein